MLVIGCILEVGQKLVPFPLAVDLLPTLCCVLSFKLILSLPSENPRVVRSPGLFLSPHLLAVEALGRGHLSLVRALHREGK